jgi:hypothetical protein
MRRLTADEVKIVLERGHQSVDGLNGDQVVESLALEVSERRVAEAAEAEKPAEEPVSA